VRTLACLLGGALLTFSAVASAQTQSPGFAVDTFNPSERGSEWFVLDSLDMRGNARPTIGVVGEWGVKPLAIYDLDGTERAAVVEHQLYLHPGASLVILERVRFALDVPIAVYNTGNDGALRAFRFKGPTDPAVGDVRGALDFRMFGRYGEAITATIGVQAFIPTGFRAQYTGDGSGRLLPRLQLAGDAGIVTYAVRGGVLFRVDDAPILGEERGHALVYGAAAGLRLVDKKLVIGPELYGSASLTNPDEQNTPLEALLGVHYTIADLVRIGAGGGPGFTKGLGTPLARAVLSIELVPGVPPPKARPKLLDSDGDGIDDKVDACPDEPGVRTNDEATNGCPPPKDTDKDGVFDLSDACPTMAGLKSDDPRKNGCPPDTDSDGVYDPIDACPNVAGVQQQDPTQNGCPPDSDRDGVIDEEDACPDVVGIKSTDPTLNGCPDPDRDKDGVPNDTDACPDEPGLKDPDAKKNGCPKAFVRGGQIRITDQVKFKTGSAEILPGKDSQSVLEAVAKVMNDHPEIKSVTVEGHTDNRGNAAMNKKLSDQRAASVVKWLAAHGVDKGRLSSIGYGQERPLDSNATEDGRKNNRRVEFHIDAAAEEK
jgi:outer membrane protein OmpA-like peptidoglycan-associated protein